MRTLAQLSIAHRPITRRRLGLKPRWIHDIDAQPFKAPGVFRAEASGAPAADWAPYDTHYTERYLVRPQGNAVGYEASFVLPYAKDLRGKFLGIHDMADDNMLLLHSMKLIRKLQEIGKPFVGTVYAGSNYGLLRQHDGRHAVATILNFSDPTLGL